MTLDSAPQLYPDEEEAVFQLRCSYCKCEVIHFEDSHVLAEIRKTGSGMLVGNECRNVGMCNCHAIAHPSPPRILMRKTTLTKLFEESKVALRA